MFIDLDKEDDELAQDLARGAEKQRVQVKQELARLAQVMPIVKQEKQSAPIKSEPPPPDYCCEPMAEDEVMSKPPPKSYSYSYCEAQNDFADDDEALKYVLDVSAYEVRRDQRIKEREQQKQQQPHQYKSKIFNPAPVLYDEDSTLPRATAPPAPDVQEKSKRSRGTSEKKKKASKKQQLPPRDLPDYARQSGKQVELPFIRNKYSLPSEVWVNIAKFVPIEDKHHFGQTCRFLLLLVLAEDEGRDGRNTIDGDAVVHLQVDDDIVDSPFIAYTREQVNFIRTNSLLLNLGKGVEYNPGLMPPYYFSMFYSAQQCLNESTMTNVQIQRQLQTLKSKKECPARSTMELELHSQMAKSDRRAGPSRFLMQIYGREVVKLVNEVNDNKRGEVVRVNGLETWRWVGEQSWKAAYQAHPRIVAKCLANQKYEPYLESQAQRKRQQKRGLADYSSSSSGYPYTPSPYTYGPCTPLASSPASMHEAAAAPPAPKKRKRLIRIPPPVVREHKGQASGHDSSDSESSASSSSSSSSSSSAASGDEDYSGNEDPRMCVPEETSTFNASLPPPPYPY